MTWYEYREKEISHKTDSSVNGFADFVLSTSSRLDYFKYTKMEEITHEWIETLDEIQKH